MTRIILCILLILLGVVGIAGGIWGFSLQMDSDVPTEVLSAARTVLSYTESGVATADTWLSEKTGGALNVTDVLNYVIGDELDLTDRGNVEWFARTNALTILLCGIISLETGLLLIKFRR